MSVIMTSRVLDQEELSTSSNNVSIPAATSFVVSFDSEPCSTAPRPVHNKFVKKHVRNLSLPVANVYAKANNYSDSNGVTKPPENHSEGYFSSDPEDDSNVHTTNIQSSLIKPSKDFNMNTSKSQTNVLGSNSNSSRSTHRKSHETGAENVQDDVEDGEKSDGGTYTIDQDSHEVINARLSIDKMFGVTTSEQTFKDYSDVKKGDSDTKDWIDEWANQVLEHNQKKSPVISSRALSKIPSPVYKRAKLPPVVPMNTPKTDLTPTSPPKQRSISLSANNIQDDCSDSSLETESYLRTTEKVVSEMFARANRSMDSAESDGEINNHPPHTLFTNKIVDHHSDSSCSERVSNQRKSLIDKIQVNSSPSNKYNRAFSLRRNKNLKSQDAPATPVSAPSNTPIATPRTGITSTAVRKVVTSSLNKSSPPVVKQAFSRTDCGRFSMRAPGKTMVTSSNLTSLSVPKTSPNPTTSVVKKKPKPSNNGTCRSNSTLSSREMEFQNWKRRKSYDPMKAAAEGKKKDSSKKQPSTPNNIMSQSVCVPEPENTSSMVLRSASFHGTRQLIAACGVKSSSEDNEEDEEDEEEDWNVPQAPKTSRENTPRGSRTSLCSLGTNSSSSNVKNRTKIEGVDSMVITAIASMSCKLKANSSHFLKKLRVLYSEENMKHGLLSSEIEKLDLSDSSNNSPVKSPSRQLTATLCNLKKIESALRVMDEAIFDCEEFE